MGGIRSGFQHLHDDCFNRLNFLHDLVVPESQHPVSLSIQTGCSLCVVIYLLGVVAAVKFYNHSLLKIHEIYDVPPDWLLTTKFVSTELAQSRVFPEDLLRLCGVLPDLPGFGGGHTTPALTFPHKGGGLICLSRSALLGGNRFGLVPLS